MYYMPPQNNPTKGQLDKFAEQIYEVENGFFSNFSFDFHVWGDYYRYITHDFRY